MPLRDFFRRAKGCRRDGDPAEDATGEGAIVPIADYEAVRFRLIELGQRLAVAEHRLVLVEGSNRTAARALRRLLEQRARHLDECAQLVDAREIAEANLSIAASDRQRTIVLNDRLLGELRSSEEARERLEHENRRLRRQASARNVADDAATMLDSVWPD